MFKPTGGAKRGEFIVIGALQHITLNQGTTLEMFKSTAIYMFSSKNGSALLMRISFEIRLKGYDGFNIAA